MRRIQIRGNRRTVEIKEKNNEMEKRKLGPRREKEGEVEETKGKETKTTWRGGDLVINLHDSLRPAAYSSSHSGNIFSIRIKVQSLTALS